MVQFYSLNCFIGFRISLLLDQGKWCSNCYRKHCFTCLLSTLYESNARKCYLSRVVEVQENQKVIETGLYGIVCYPMYFATLLIFLSMSLVLGSYVGFMVMLFYPLTIVIRIKNEEEVLEKSLKEYKEYKEK